MYIKQEPVSDIENYRKVNIDYIYDDVHKVCIWITNNGIAVLPVKDVSNPERNIKGAR